MKSIERYAVFELELAGTPEECQDADITACFHNDDQAKTDRITMKGFYAGNGKAIIRFMPELEGVWNYTATWGEMSVKGSFRCIANQGQNHGPVKADGMHFRYADGTRFIPMGTTCYAWIHQTEELQEQTLATLQKSAFNKVRMCVFPKSMNYNRNDPDCYPFERDALGNWEISKPDSSFWEKLEKRIMQLGELGIEADLILFHPYDRWGFADLSREENLAYLDYCVRRLAAFRNVWWSLSNEYDLVFTKTIEDWDAFGDKVKETDPYSHLVSAHNWLEPYPKRDWMTHVSWQGSSMQEAFKLRAKYQLPTVVDELGYEGDIESDWGNNSAFEIVNRMWMAVAFGCYCTHGETYYREDEVLWWAKGGRLYGKAPERIAFLKELLEQLPGAMEPVCRNVMDDPTSMAKSPEHAKLVRQIWDNRPQNRNVFINEFIVPIGINPDYRLNYLQRHCNAFYDIELPVNGEYDVEVIDVWEMTRKRVMESVSGAFRINLPSKEGIAILVMRRSGELLA